VPRALSLLFVLAGAGLLFLWSRATASATALEASSDPFASLSDFADQAVAAVVGWDIPARGQRYAVLIDAAEIRHGIPHNLLARLLYQESRFRADIISGETKSSAGALGIAQFMPQTAAQFGIDPLDPPQAIDAAGKYLAQLYARFGSWSLALAAYNFGPGNVAKHGLVDAPAETRDYVAQITSDVPVA
jgi:soluble lytic murein transglycosylase-like protein